MNANPVLVGSTFPLSLVRRRVVITPARIEELRERLAVAGLVSFWGHANTVNAASGLVGADLTPREARPVLKLTSAGYPELEGCVHQECWVLSPDYVPGFRPAVGEEVAAEKITGWQVLRVRWEDKPGPV